MDKDILIIGGGPSGLSTALHLAKFAPALTPRILILEKEHYPRPKLCAGGLVIDAERILEQLGLDVTEIPHVDSKNIKFDFAGRGLNVHMSGRHALRVIRRNEFDQWLAKKTGAKGVEIRQGVSVKRIVPKNDGVKIETDQGNFHAKIVIGADGSNGVTRRSIFPNNPVYTARLLEIITPTYSQSNKREASAFFDFFPVPNNIAGYTWDFPTQVNGESMRCWGIYDSNMLSNFKRPALKEPLAKEMERHGLNLDDYEIKGHPIRWYDPGNKVSIPNILLVGDAVGADPIFGEGISIALGFGVVAAREIISAFQKDDFSFNEYKRRLAWSGLGQTLFARWLIAQIIYTFKWKWFQILLWRMIKPIALLVAWIFVLNWSKRL